MDEEYGVGSGNSAIGESLCKPSKFIGRRFVPDCAVFWALCEFFIFEVLAGVVITDELCSFTLFLLSELHVGSMW